MMKYVQAPMAIQVSVPKYLEKEARFLKNELTVPIMENLHTDKPIHFGALYEKVKKSVSGKVNNKKEFVDYMASLGRAGLVYHVFTRSYTDGYLLSPMGKKLLTSVSRRA